MAARYSKIYGFVLALVIAIGERLAAIYEAETEAAALVA